MVSAFFVKPTLNYVNYIDFRVLGILLSLMTVMAGLQRNGLFDMIGSSLLKRTKNTMQLSLVLVFLCFFFSMFITNDVSLITFVPFAMLTLRKCNQEKLLIPVIIVQTLAANLGSMLTPIGNPQKFISLQSCRDENVNIYRNYRSIYVNIRYIAAVICCCCMQKKKRRLNLHSKKITATMKLKKKGYIFEEKHIKKMQFI